MARNIVYHMSEAYDIGYDDGYKDGYLEGCMVGSLKMKEKMLDKLTNNTFRNVKGECISGEFISSQLKKAIEE